MTLMVACSKDGSTTLNPMPFSDMDFNNIFEKLRYQRSTGRYCDALIVVSDKTFSAHRMVLAANSPYFDSILKNDKIIKEKIIVNSQYPDIFELILNYMYSGTIVIDRIVITELLRLANNLLILRLKRYCAEYLQQFIDASNCLFVKSLAMKYNLPELLKNADEFFTNNINTCLIESSDILGYTEKQLKMLFNASAYVKLIRPDVNLSLIVRWVQYDLKHRELLFSNFLDLFPLGQVSISKLEHILDYNPFFKQSEQSLYALLSKMYFLGIKLPKYDLQYRSLVQKYGEFSPSHDHLLKPLSEESSVIDSESETIAELHSKKTIDDLCLSNEEIHASSAHKDPLKLINFSNISQLSSHQRRIISSKLFRKSTAMTKHQKGRPSKKQPILVDEEPRSSFFEFEDDLTAVVFDENDDDVHENIKIEFANLTDQPGLSEYLCNLCSYRTNYRDKYLKHMEIHSNSTLYVCNICNFECCCNKEFYNHMRQHFPGPIYYCDSCTYNSEKITVLLTHRLIHTDEKPFKCPECSFRCRTKHNLAIHHRYHSGEKPFMCLECKKCFAVMKNLEQHKVVHSDERPYSCDQCTFSTKYQSHLISHRRKHSGNVFRCEIQSCDYSSPKKSQLAAHLRTHLAFRPFTCRICHRSFVEKSHLVRHERIHLDEKPFKCESCDYSSSRRDKLKEHISKHHNDDNKQNKRRNRRARQLKQLAGGEKFRLQSSKLSLDTSKLFRPIHHDKYLQDQNGSEQHISPEQQPSNSIDHEILALRFQQQESSQLMSCQLRHDQHQQFNPIQIQQSKIYPSNHAQLQTQQMQHFQQPIELSNTNLICQNHNLQQQYQTRSCSVQHPYLVDSMFEVVHPGRPPSAPLEMSFIGQPFVGSAQLITLHGMATDNPQQSEINISNYHGNVIQSPHSTGDFMDYFPMESWAEQQHAQAIHGGGYIQRPSSLPNSNQLTNLQSMGRQQSDFHAKN